MLEIVKILNVFSSTPPANLTNFSLVVLAHILRDLFVKNREDTTTVTKDTTTQLRDNVGITANVRHGVKNSGIVVFLDKGGLNLN